MFVSSQVVDKNGVLFQSVRKLTFRYVTLCESWRYYLRAPWKTRLIR